MDFSQASNRFRIPRKALYLLKGMGLLSEPLQPDEINNLAFVSQFWGKAAFVSLMLARRSVRTRQRIVRGVGLTRPER